MSRLRDEDFVRPSYAAILRQQEADARLSEPAHLGVAPPLGPEGPSAPDVRSKPQVQCWIVSDLEEPLLYI